MTRGGRTRVYGRRNEKLADSAIETCRSLKQAGAH